MNHRINLIREVQIEDQVITGVENSQKQIREYFQKSYSQETLPLIELPQGVFKEFSIEDVASNEKFLLTWK